MRRGWSASPARRRPCACLCLGSLGLGEYLPAPGFREGKAPAQGCTACLPVTEAMSCCLRGLDFILQTTGAMEGF